MNKNNDPVLRALYIILVPVVLLIIVLNSGMLQRWVPAAQVHGQNYSVVRYNYYYFDYYNSFLEENEFILDELGYDPTVSDSTQYTEDGLTWKEFFQRRAEENMAETAYYYDLAADNGYVFSEEELLPVEEKLAAHTEKQLAAGIGAKNYYTAYYGAGMTEEAYTAELARQVKAQAYKNYLIRSAAPTQAEIDAYIEANNIPAYQTLNLRVITLAALPERETGTVGQEQLNALTEKMDRLVERYEAGESFASLQAAFSTCALGDRSGVLQDATSAELPVCIAESWLQVQDQALVGSYMTGIDPDSGIGYFAVLDGFGGSGQEREAALVLGENALLEQAASAIAENYSVKRLSFGMLLATA